MFLAVIDCFSDFAPTNNNFGAVGIDLHHEVRGQLQKRWLNEPNIDGVNKGELSIASYVDERPVHSRRLIPMIVAGIKNPTRAARAVARRIRRIISR